ncbi:hypothetical protein KKG58_05685 [Patescibacteria group bacterium]|nr:hypothetical protein [Patescibacteria group bacterium]
MSYADEMKNLVGDIKSSHRDRTADVKNLFSETQELLEADRKELQEMAKELKDFLAKSENARMTDFRSMIKGIQDRVEEIEADSRKLLAQFDKEMAEMSKDLKAFLAKGENERMADFRVMAKDIQARITEIFRDTKGLLGEYKEERKRAAGYWASLGGKIKEDEQAISTAAKPAAKPKPKAKKRAPSKKKKK